ncbi:unnamed protein product [Effrenium voratum]|nr:unnamed protein product [Effrenium voratum]
MTPAQIELTIKQLLRMGAPKAFAMLVLLAASLAIPGGESDCSNLEILELFVDPQILLVDMLRHADDSDRWEALRDKRERSKKLDEQNQKLDPKIVSEHEQDKKSDPEIVSEHERNKKLDPEIEIDETQPAALDAFPATQAEAGGTQVRQNLADRLGLAAEDVEEGPPLESGADQGEATEGEDLFQVPTENPPPQLSEGAIKKRLYRLLTPKASGALKVPKELINDYNDPFTKDKVFLLFEKAGYDREVFLRKVRKVYEQINEDTMESNYEFLSEDDMVALGWKKIKGIKKFCKSKRDFTRQSDYGEGTLYWALISQKGSKKKIRRSILQEIEEEELKEPSKKKVHAKVKGIDTSFVPEANPTRTNPKQKKKRLLTDMKDLQKALSKRDDDMQQVLMNFGKKAVTPKAKSAVPKSAKTAAKHAPKPAAAKPKPKPKAEPAAKKTSSAFSNMEFG